DKSSSADSRGRSAPNRTTPHDGRRRIPPPPAGSLAGAVEDLPGGTSGEVSRNDGALDVSGAGGGDVGGREREAALRRRRRCAAVRVPSGTRSEPGAARERVGVPVVAVAQDDLALREVFLQRLPDRGGVGRVDPADAGEPGDEPSAVGLASGDQRLKGGWPADPLEGFRNAARDREHLRRGSRVSGRGRPTLLFG